MRRLHTFGGCCGWRRGEEPHTASPQGRELWKSYKLKMLKSEVHRVRVSGDNAVVAGRQQETVSCADDSCPSEIALFLRTYVRRQNRWQLFSSAQFRDPKDGRTGPNSQFPHDPF